MFTDQSFESTGFTSETTTDKSQTASNVQTDTIVYESKESQRTIVRNAGTQTTAPASQGVSFDYEKLASFMRRVTPQVIEILDEVHGSNAFEGYDPCSSEEPITRVQLLSSLWTLGEAKTDTKISALSWSTGGGYLAAAHSAIYHETWCDHLSQIKFYQIPRTDTIGETAAKTIEVQSCVTTLSYHPSEPSILAAGLFNGDVLLWNLRDDESVTPVQICVHGDMVTSLLWGPRTTDFSIVTSSMDGYIYVNKVTSNFTNVALEKKFKIPKEHNPAIKSRPRSSGGRRERAIEAGLSIMCLDFSTIYPRKFVAGTLCGGIYKCSLDETLPLDSSDDDRVELSDPVIGDYERHDASVTCVKCSPTRNIFVSCGTDKEIRIYDFDQTIKLQVINVEATVLTFNWYTKSDRDIIAAYGASSSVDFYDATDGTLLPNLQMESARENTSCLDFNLKRDLAAVGDTQGKLELWKVSSQVVS